MLQRVRRLTARKNSPSPSPSPQSPPPRASVRSAEQLVRAAKQDFQRQMIALEEEFAVRADQLLAQHTQQMNRALEEADQSTSAWAAEPPPRQPKHAPVERRETIVKPGAAAVKKVLRRGLTLERVEQLEEQMRRKGIHVDMLVSDSEEEDKLETEEVSRHQRQRAMQQLKTSHQRVASQPKTHNRVARILAATSPKQRGSRRGNRNFSEMQDGDFGSVRDGLRNVRDNGRGTEDDTIDSAQDDFDYQAPVVSKARAKKSRALWYASSEDY